MPNRARDDATPTYRGYRRQTLYTLSRILGFTVDAQRIYQPEGIEDLAVFDAADRLVEIVQVKDLTEDLSLSSFSANKADSFFFRAAAALERVPDLRIVIATFGPIGPGLAGAIDTDGSERTSVAKRLSSTGRITEAKARNLLAHMVIQRVTESDLTEQVQNALRTTLTGIDPDRAFENLNYWLYLCAEGRRKVTRSAIITRLTQIGHFLAERAAFHQEWFITIVPLTDDLGRDHAELADEYYRGIGARYDHILAELDVIRTDKLREIADKFREKRVVIIHGASGQGKTTLAYRFLHDFFPSEWRLFIRAVAGRDHALRVARAVSGHASAIGVPVAVYFDVSPSDSGWEEAVKELSADPNLRILVTIREEDWRRTTITGADLDFETVELTLHRNEARDIYQSLVARRVSDRYLSFPDAWEAFDNQGPLLEFVYLVTQGASLRERLAAQVHRIQGEVETGVRPRGDLDLLTVVSVASVFGARLKLAPLVESLQLPVPARSIERMEKEYLLRIAGGGAWVQGLHPVRSAILADLLIDPVLLPWTKVSIACLPFVADDDIEVFLLHAFTWDAIDAGVLVDALSYLQADTWVATNGVLRSLLWLGLREYVRMNDAVIERAHGAVGHAWSYVLDFDIMGVSVDSLMSLWRSDMASPALTELVETLRRSQSDKAAVLAYARAWLANRTEASVYPGSEGDWAALAETLFWIGRLEVNYPLPDWLPDPGLNEALAAVSLDTLADLVLGASSIRTERFVDALREMQPQFLERFRQETQTAVVEDDGTTIRAHYLIPIDLLVDGESEEPSAGSSDEPPNIAGKDKDPLHDESMRRVSLLRRLVPDRESFGCQGYGHGAEEAGLIDTTQKQAIPQHLLPSRWAVTINAAFRGLGAWKFRCDSWLEYADQVLAIRKAAVEELRKLDRALHNYFRTRQKTDILGRSVDPQAWDSCQTLLRNVPLLPRCVVDAWGFSSEENQQRNIREGMADRMLQRRGLAIQRYKPLTESIGEYARPLGNFFGQAPSIMTLNAVLGRQVTSGAQRIRVMAEATRQGTNPRFAHLSTINFAGALTALPEMQRAFRQFLSPFVRGDTLDHLERRETELVTSVWCMWYHFAFHPEQVMADAPRECRRRYTAVMRQVRENLRRDLRELSSDTLRISIASETAFWDSLPALWVTIDGEDAVAAYGSVEEIIGAVRGAIGRVEATELRRFAVEQHWPFVVVVPLFRGKFLLPRAWRFSLPVMLSTDAATSLKWWNYVLQTIPATAVTALGLRAWKDPRLESAASVLERLGELTVLVRYLANLRSLPTISDSDMKWLQSYVGEIAERVGETGTAVANMEAEFLVGLQLSLVNDPQTLSDIQAFLDAVKTLHEQILPSADFSGTVTMNLEECEGWADRLEEAKKIAALIYLIWAAYILASENV